MHRFSFWPVREHAPHALWTGYPEPLTDVRGSEPNRDREEAVCRGCRMRSVGEAPVHVRHTWYHKLGVILFVIVCFEVGVFLLIFSLDAAMGWQLVRQPAPRAARLLDQLLLPRRLERPGACSTSIFRLASCCAFAVALLLIGAPPADRLKVSTL